LPIPIAPRDHRARPSVSPASPKLNFIIESRERYLAASVDRLKWRRFFLRFEASLVEFLQEVRMLGRFSKTALAATTALIIGLAPIATADFAFARGGGGMRAGGGGGGHFGGGRFAGGGFHGGGFHRGGGRFGFGAGALAAGALFGGYGAYYD
jgi:hypothetical protein